MRRLLLCYLLSALSFASFGQGFSAHALLETVTLPITKFDSYLLKKGFIYVRRSNQNDTIAKTYNFKGIAKQKFTDSIKREIISFTGKPGFYFTYHTFSEGEYQKIIKGLKEEGFFCNLQKDSLPAASLLFQNKDLTVTISSQPVDTLTQYSFLMRKQTLPSPKEILFAEDLSVFDSHEYLRYYFGDKNVKKDIYYLSQNQVGKCSVLFSNTKQQVVFLWADETNNCKLEKIYIGGQLRTGSSLEYDKIVAENIWQLKSGIHAGMSLYSLRQLNESAFNFYGGNSANTGMVLKENTGKLDFTKAAIILGCMNCTDAASFKRSVINSDDAINEGLILFVHTVILAVKNDP